MGTAIGMPGRDHTNSIFSGMHRPSRPGGIDVRSSHDGALEYSQVPLNAAGSPHCTLGPSATPARSGCAFTADGTGIYELWHRCTASVATQSGTAGRQPVRLRAWVETGPDFGWALHSHCCGKRIGHGQDVSRHSACPAAYWAPVCCGTTRADNSCTLQTVFPTILALTLHHLVSAIWFLACSPDLSNKFLLTRSY